MLFRCHSFCPAGHGASKCGPPTSVTQECVRNVESRPPPDLLNHHFWGWSPGICVLKGLPCDSGAYQGLGNIAVGYIGVRVRWAVGAMLLFGGIYLPPGPGVHSPAHPYPLPGLPETEKGAAEAGEGRGAWWGGDGLVILQGNRSTLLQFQQTCRGCEGIGRLTAGGTQELSEVPSQPGQLLCTLVMPCGDSRGGLTAGAPGSTPIHPPSPSSSESEPHCELLGTRRKDEPSR